MGNKLCSLRTLFGHAIYDTSSIKQEMQRQPRAKLAGAIRHKMKHELIAIAIPRRSIATRRVGGFHF